MRHAFARFVLPAILFGISPVAAACGEGMFHMGEGVRFQGYLAPRPATVLVLDSDRAPPDERIAVYRGLVQAGHQLTVAHDAAEVAQAMAQRQYDVIIADFDAIDTVSSAAPAGVDELRLLPVVERSQRDTPGLRERFDQFVVAGASTGQYLRRIDSLMAE